MKEASAIFCEHANECPQVCPCTSDCYCRSHTCKGRPTSEWVSPEAKEAELMVRAAQRVRGVRRVKVEDRPGMPQFGVFLGLLLDEHGDTQAIVQLDNHGLMLKALHPSKVTAVTPEEETAFK